jgi:hypothetical protein
VISSFVGTDFLDMFPDFVSEYNIFEEMLEQTIAKTLVLPKIIAHYFQRKVAAKRLQLKGCILHYINKKKENKVYRTLEID